MLSVVAPEHPALHPHQAEAIAATVEQLMSHDRGQVRMACGTGKTLTAIRLAERLGADLVLVFVPNLSLLAQTMREFQKLSIRPFRALAVCSDTSVADQDSGALAEIPIKVTTNATVLAAELTGRRARTVVFATYHSAGVVAAAQSERAPAFDLILADEAHRTAGHGEGPFGLVLDAGQVRGTKRVFLTATARTDVGQDGRSMDNESLYGPVFYEYTFRQAIDAELLCPYRVVIVGITDEMIRPYLDKGAEVVVNGVTLSGSEAAAAVAVLKAMEDYGLRRMVSFHSTVQGAADFANVLPGVARWMAPEQADGLRTGHVNGQMSSTERTAALDALRALGPAEKMVLTNARCLTEGVDVPAIDAVAFIDPKSSYIDVVQAAGRALRRAPGKNVGTILLTVYVGDGENADQAVATSRFADIRTVLQVLLDHDPDFAAALAAGTRAAGFPGTSAGEDADRGDDSDGAPLGGPAAAWSDADMDDVRDIERAEAAAEARAGGGDSGVTVTWDMPAGISARFHRALCTRLLTPTPGRFWEQRDRLAAYVTEHDRLPTPKTDRQLYTWMTEQRRDWRAGRITPQKAAALEEIPGWNWAPERDKGKARARVAELDQQGLPPAAIAAQLNAEGHRRGTAALPHTIASVNKLRKSTNKQLTDGIPLAEQWNTRYQQLRDWVNARGSLTWGTRGMPPGLSQWMRDQRRNYRHHRPRLTTERIALLENVPGWLWADPADEFAA